MNSGGNTIEDEMAERNLFGELAKSSFWSAEPPNTLIAAQATRDASKNPQPFLPSTTFKANAKSRSVSPADSGHAKRVCTDELGSRPIEDQENTPPCNFDVEIYNLKLQIRERVDFYLNKELNDAKKVWNECYFQPSKENVSCVVTPVADFSELKMHSVRVKEEIVKRKVTVEEAAQIKESYMQKRSADKKPTIGAQNEPSQVVKTSSTEDPVSNPPAQKPESSKPKRSSRRGNKSNVPVQENPEKTATVETPDVPLKATESTETVDMEVDNNEQEERKEESNKAEEPTASNANVLAPLDVSVEASATVTETESFSKPKRSSKARVRFNQEDAANESKKSSQTPEEPPVKTMTTVKELERSDNEFGVSVAGEIIAVKSLLSQYQVPLMNSYLSTPFNIRIPDATELQNCPYLGDELDERKKKFLDDLIYNFEGKLRAWDQIEDMPPPLFVEVVQLVWKSFGADLKDPSLDLRDPPLHVINRLGQLFSNDDHIKLRERYINFTSDKEVVKTLKDVTDQDVVFSREKSMETLLKFFCRRCYVYDCEMHDPVPLPPVEKYPSDMPKNQLPCKNGCYMQHFTCLYYCKTLPEAGKEAHLSAGTWSNTETTLLNLLAPGHAKDVCNLSTCFILKNCLQVFLKMLELGTLEKLFDKESAETVKPLIDSFEDLRLQPEIGESAARFEYKPGLFFNKRDETDLVNKVLSRQQNLTKHPYYQPCHHRGDSSGTGILCGVGGERCECVARTSFCDKSCGCSLDCPNRFPGCRCTKLGCQSKSSCLCLMARRECDPDLCVNCCALTDAPFTDYSEAPLTHQLPDAADIPAEVTPEVMNEYVKQSGYNHCKNFNLQRRQRNANVVLGVSEVAGWGIFATKAFRPGEFIGEYRGEVISHNEAERRGQMYDRNFNSYLFGLNSDFVVDATVKGCKMRFINHSDKPNCSAKVLQVCGDHRIGIYACRNIKPGHELSYNYRYSGRHKKKKGGAKDGGQEESEDEDSEEEEEDYSEEGEGQDSMGEDSAADDRSSCCEEPPTFQKRRNPPAVKFELGDDCE